MTQRRFMENTHIFKCRNQLWLVFFALFVFWYTLIYVFDWSSLNGLSLSKQSHTQPNPIEFRTSIPHPEDPIQIDNKLPIPDVKNQIPESGSDNRTEIVQGDISRTSIPENGNESVPEETKTDTCSGRYVYVHEIPRQFNLDVIEDCRLLDKWADMCQYMTNMGLGQKIPSDKIFSRTGFFSTHQFSLEVIFHNRMNQYDCLTNDSSKASAIFVPYYAGLDVARYLWGSTTYQARDSGSIELFKWLKDQKQWKVMNGRDHFLIAGRITWDFRRGIDDDSAWGNKLMLLPEALNAMILTIESSPWHENDFAIPYPTYFHPAKDSEVIQWQNRMRRLKRRYLFSFAGAPRPNWKGSIRTEIMTQCQASRRRCRLLECKDIGNKCLKPAYLMKLFQSSAFCLQPPGDSFTRRSIFDSIVAGCIPVFFHPGSAYVQYLWHLPKDYNKYSVMIPEDDVKGNKVKIESELEKISRERVIKMREEVIKLIPKVVYADPRGKLEKLEDAFDLSVKGVIGRVNKLRKEGKTYSVDSSDNEFSWKQNFFGEKGGDEWDHYFDRINNTFRY